MRHLVYSFPFLQSLRFSVNFSSDKLHLLNYLMLSVINGHLEFSFRLTLKAEQEREVREMEI